MRDFLPLNFFKVSLYFKSFHSLLSLELCHLSHSLHGLAVFPAFHVQLVTLQVTAGDHTHMTLPWTLGSWWGAGISWSWWRFLSLLFLWYRNIQEADNNSGCPLLLNCNLLLIEFNIRFWFQNKENPDIFTSSFKSIIFKIIALCEILKKKMTLIRIKINHIGLTLNSLYNTHISSIITKALYRNLPTWVTL